MSFAEKFGAKAVEPPPKNKPNQVYWFIQEEKFVYRAEGVELFLNPLETSWEMIAHFGQEKYKGQRATLEEAFRTLDNLLYQKNKDLWLKTNCGVVLRQFEGDLEGL